MLKYLAEHALKHPGALKEYQIATEVFGRPPDFDPHLDSLVRVQAGRLRGKMAEYYANEGANDPILVELPKGTYNLVFHRQAVVTEGAQGTQPESKPSAKRRNWIVPVLAGLLFLALIAIGMLLASRPPSSTASADAVPAAVRTFWHKFASGSEPWVIFSNGAFVGRPETGLRYFNPATDSRQAILDHYTGVGEVLAVHELDHIFELLNKPLRVKRGSLFTLDDVQNNDLIFVGSPAENLTLRDIPSTKEFVFQRLTSGPRRGDLAVVNLHPQPGEEKMFLSTPAGTPLVEDYAIVGLVPGLNPARSVLILAGTTTLGTEAAAEYVCRQDSLEHLLLRLSVSENGEMNPFEAVLRVKVTRGVPVETELVGLRKLAQ